MEMSSFMTMWIKMSEVVLSPCVSSLFDFILTFICVRALGRIWSAAPWGVPQSSATCCPNAIVLLSHSGRCHLFLELASADARVVLGLLCAVAVALLDLSFVFAFWGPNECCSSKRSSRFSHFTSSIF